MGGGRLAVYDMGGWISEGRGSGGFHVSRFLPGVSSCF
jgi:hypothetical protein